MAGWWWYLAYGFYYAGFVVMGLIVVALVAVPVVVARRRSTRAFGQAGCVGCRTCRDAT